MVKEQPALSNLAIEVENLGRVYKIRGSKKEKDIRKELVALQDVNLQVKKGELFGLLGPNGADKTTPDQNIDHPLRFDISVGFPLLRLSCPGTRSDRLRDKLLTVVTQPRSIYHRKQRDYKYFYTIFSMFSMVSIESL